MKLDDMPIYQDSVDLAKSTRELFNIMNKADQFSIGQQMLRSSVSIPSNIAEGIGRGYSPKMLLTYLGYSKGSLYELKTQLLIIEVDYSHSEVPKIMNNKIAALSDGLFKFMSFIENKKNT